MKAFAFGLACALLCAAPSFAGKLSLVGTIPARLDGANPQSAVTPLNGVLYGATQWGGAYAQGAIFSIDPNTKTETILHSFNGADGTSPNGSLLPLNGLLYGTTQNSIYTFDPSTNAITVLSTPPVMPTNGFVLLNGQLYGAASSSSGTAIYSVDPSTGAFSLGATFTSHDPITAPLTAVGNALFGTTDGSVYGGVAIEYNVSSNTVTTICQGGNTGCFYNTYSGLTLFNSLLYGTDPAWDMNGQEQGALYSINPQTGAFNIAATFSSAAGSCSFPLGPPIAVGNRIYGTVDSCANGRGGIFAFDPSSQTLTTLASFAATDAISLASGVLAATGSTLFGIAANLVNGGFGGVFSADISSGTLTPLHGFVSGVDQGSGGPYPGLTGSLISHLGSLYGASWFGGDYDSGSIYRVDAATGAVSALYSFTGGSDGANPESGVVLYRGKLYGTAAAGGIPSPDFGGGYGVVFVVDPASGAETVLHRFSGLDGDSPSSTPVVVGNVLYGTAQNGGSLDDGTLFSIDLKTGLFKTLRSFAPPGPCGPEGQLTTVAATIYGTASGTTYGSGRSGCSADVFAYDTVSGKFSNLRRFAVEVERPTKLSQGLSIANGNVVGAVYTKPTDDYPGYLFSYSPATGAFSTLLDMPADLGAPLAPLLSLKGALYGAAQAGAVFDYSVANNQVTKLCDFGPLPRYYPASGLAASGGKLWGIAFDFSGFDFASNGTVFVCKP